MKIDRRQLKRNGRRALRVNYWCAVAVCFLLSFFGAEYVGATAWMKDTGLPQSRVDAIVVQNSQAYSNWDALNDVFRFFKASDNTPDEELDSAKNAMSDEIKSSITDESGAFSFRRLFETLHSLSFDTLTEGASFLFKLMTGGYDIFVLGQTADGVLMLISALAEIAFAFFVLKMLLVGGKRFFIENQRRFDRKTRISTLLYPFFSGRFLHMVRVMLLKTIFLDLWSLTIVGGVIKSYEYRLIPYILADQPDLSRKEVFRRSKQMMRGHKRQLFLFDLSFLGWSLLNLISFGLVGLFYYHPYKSAAEAEFYAARKDELDSEVQHG